MSELHEGDKELLKATTTGAGLIPLTPDLMEKIGESIKARNEADAVRFPALVAACDYDTRLAITAQVFEAIVNNAKCQGSFRYLIYDQLGFNPDAYLPLYQAGGMTINNHMFEMEATKIEWQPIDTAPKDGTRILLTDGNTIISGSFRDNSWRVDKGLRWDDTDSDIFFDVTHWMPLPEGPK